MLNHIVIMGRLTRDPELRSTQSGVSVASFTVAVNRRKTANNQNPEADFFNVNAWRVLGENAARFLTKGSKVAVVGRVSLKTWDNNGKHGASLEVYADDIEYLSKRVSDPVETPTPPVDARTGMQVVETDVLPF